MIGAIGNFVPNTIRIDLPDAARIQGSITPLESVGPALQEVLPPISPTQASFGDSLITPLLLSPSDFADVFSIEGAGNGLFSSLLPQFVSAFYSQSSLLTSSRLSLVV